MSYSSQTKEELCRFEPDSVCCLLAELSGIVCAAGSVIYRGGGDKRLSIETENNAVARRAFRLLREVFDVQPQLVTLKRSRLGGRSAYRIEISGSEASFVLEGCGIEMGQRRGVPREITVRKCCRMSFLRGVFLACGSVTDPEKEYHLEFVLEDEAFARACRPRFGRRRRCGWRTRRCRWRSWAGCAIRRWARAVSTTGCASWRSWRRSWTDRRRRRTPRKEKPMELTIKIAIPKEMMTRQAADIAQRMSGFESRVLLKRQNMTVNAKSLMGVLSAELRDGQAVTILAEGPDEAQAVCTLSKMLGA